MLERPEPVTTLDHRVDRTRHARRWLRRGLVAFLCAAIAVAVSGVLGRRQSEAKLDQWTQAQALPAVAIVRPQRLTKGQELVLPGNVEAFYEARIYARVNGYLNMWYQDIGAHVKAGQLLAGIDAPELDQRLEQAKNDLASEEASASLATLTAKRWAALLASQAVSRQSADEKTSDAVRRRAVVAAARANVERLQALESFKRITAPFDGVVTSRQTDIGALINAGSGSGTELFRVADIHKMRIYVRVPQAYAAQIQIGMVARLRLPQFPDRMFAAKVETTSNAITRESRTVLVELMADNPDGTLWPGTFAEIHLDLPPNGLVYQLPTSALVFRENGLEVATVGPGDTVALKPISAGRDLGTQIEVTAGLAPTDRVIDSPPDSLTEGDRVRIAPDAEAQASMPPQPASQQQGASRAK